MGVRAVVTMTNNFGAVTDEVMHRLVEGENKAAERGMALSVDRSPWDQGTLAGAHSVERATDAEEGAAAVGNVYVRRDRRGRGLGRLVTTAVLDALAGVETIGLNVRADNDAALRLYESLGFARHCEFYEALATP